MPHSAELPTDTAGVAGPSSSRVSLIVHDAIAAVVGEVSVDRALGTPEDLRAHARVPDELAASTTVLPFRFGAVLRDGQAVSDELLVGHAKDSPEDLNIDLGPLGPLLPRD